MKVATLVPGALVVVVAIGLACPAAKETRMDEAVFGKLERAYAGRFSLQVPAGARRYGEEYQVHHITLTEVNFAEPLDKAFARAWTAKLAEITSLKAKRTRPYHIVGDIHSQHELEPRFSAVLYHTDNVKIAVQYAALRQVGPNGLWLTRPGDTEDVKPTLDQVLVVGKAWMPGLASSKPAPGDLFHLPHGAIRLPFEEQESATAVFQGGPLDVEVTLSTESTSQPRGGGLMARFGQAVAKAGASFAAGLSPVRTRSRDAAGLSGEEFVVRDSENERLYFLWEFKGEANSGTKPEVQVRMVTDNERQKNKIAFWDALVDSLRPAAAP